MRRAFSSCASTFKVLRMPSLSPTMSKGRLEKWHIKDRENVKCYDLLLEVSTTSLLKDSHQVSTLEVEIIEDGFIKQLVKEGIICNAGDPIAIISESKWGMDKDIPNIPETNTLSDALWQGYIKR